MKRYSLDELRELAKPTFKANPKADKLYATSDGQFFLEDKKNAAEFHAKQAKVKVYEVEALKGNLDSARSPESDLDKEAILAKAEDGEALSNEEFQELTVAEVKNYVALLDDAEAIKDLGEHDTKGGKAAVEARIEELAADSTASDTNENED
jgi:hypothetical protein